MTPKERAAMQQALEALHNVGNSLMYLAPANSLSPMHVEMRDDAVNGANEAITALREALAERQITTPDVCGEVCARAKLCYGCNKDLEDANAKYAEQAEQRSDSELMEPVGIYYGEAEGVGHSVRLDVELPIGTKLYSAPVRTKDLTDDEKLELARSSVGKSRHWLVEAAIAADREKNNV